MHKVENYIFGNCYLYTCISNGNTCIMHHFIAIIGLPNTYKHIPTFLIYNITDIYLNNLILKKTV